MRKFIITSDGEFKYGDVTMHKDLLGPSDTCIGGGFYEFDYVSNRLLLTGRSYDFGYPQWDDIEVLRLPEALRGLAVLYEGQTVELPFEYIE